MTRFVEIHLGDEARPIGAGCRTVFVDRIGRRKVRLIEPATLRRVALDRETWDRLEAMSRPVNPDLQRLAKRVRALVRARRRKLTGAERRMIEAGSDTNGTPATARRGSQQEARSAGTARQGSQQ